MLSWRGRKGRGARSSRVPSTRRKSEGELIVGRRRGCLRMRLATLEAREMKVRGSAVLGREVVDERRVREGAALKSGMGGGISVGCWKKMGLSSVGPAMLLV